MKLKLEISEFSKTSLSYCNGYDTKNSDNKESLLSKKSDTTGNRVSKYYTTQRHYKSAMSL